EGEPFDFLQQVVDRLVAGGGDADALAAREELDDEVRAGEGFAGAGRALNEEGAVVEGEDGGEGFVEERGLTRQNGVPAFAGTTGEARGMFFEERHDGAEFG